MNPENTPQSFDFSKYRVKESGLQNEYVAPNTHAAEPDNTPFDFSQYRLKQPPTRFEEFTRHAARTGARVGETIAGFPGDVVHLTNYLASYLPETPDIFKREPNFIQKAGAQALQSLPSSNELKEFSSHLTKGYTDPKGAAEELGDEISSLATVLINPSKAVTGFPQFLKTVGGSVGKAIGVKSAGKGAELLGADESTKNKVELGALFLTGFLGKKSVDKYVGEQYDKARSSIPKGTMVNTTGLESALNQVDQLLARGLSTDTKDEVKKALSELKAKASGGAMELDELVESYHNINERLNSKKLFDELSTSEKRLLKSRYDLVKDEVENEIQKYGKSNPEFYKTWKGANDGFATIAQSKKVSRFLESKLGKIPHHLAGSLALDLFLKSPAATIGVAGTYSAIKAGELLYRIAKSPTLRDHYTKFIMEAGNENLPGVIKHLEALNKAVPK